MNNKLIISIIVPVFNVEKYIAKCLDSLLSQGLDTDEYEIILVNDGSTDNSLSICQDYQRQYGHIVVKSQPNSGPGVARNTGLEMARGEYVYFIDSDDYLVSGGLSFVRDNFIGKYDSDLIIFNSSVVDNADKERKKERPDGKLLYHGQMLDFMLKESLIMCTVYRFMCKRSFLNEHKLRFSSYMVNEDMLFSSSLFLLNPSVLRISCNLYRYVIHANSICTKREEQHNRKCVQHHLSSMKVMHELLAQHHLAEHYPVLFRLYIKTMNQMTFYFYKKVLCANYGLKEYKEVLAALLENRLLPLEPIGTDLKCRVSRFVINMLMKIPVLYKPTCFLYNEIIVKCILREKR